MQAPLQRFNTPPFPTPLSFFPPLPAPALALCVSVCLCLSSSIQLISSLLTSPPSRIPSHSSALRSSPPSSERTFQESVDNVLNIHVQISHRCSFHVKQKRTEGHSTTVMGQIPRVLPLVRTERQEEQTHCNEACLPSRWLTKGLEGASWEQGEQCVGALVYGLGGGGGLFVSVWPCEISLIFSDTIHKGRRRFVEDALKLSVDFLHCSKGRRRTKRSEQRSEW